MSEQSSESVVNSQNQNEEPSQNNKEFVFENGRIQYCNVEQTVVHEQQCIQLVVHNYLCYQQQDKLIKITQILFENKVLRIRDELKIIKQLIQVEPQQKRPLGVFGRRNNYSDPTKNEKSDTKNLIKNIINIFSNWLRIKNTEQAIKANRKLKQIVKKMKYFNKILIQQLCKDKDICECFIEFNETDSEASIENSRIKDKQCHCKAIKNYTKLFIQSNNRLSKQQTKSSQTKTSNNCQ